MMLMPKIFDDDFFRDDFFSDREKERFQLMKTDIREDENKYMLDVDLPGYKKENIKIDITDGYLTIHAKTDGEKEEKEKGKYVRRERYTGEVTRSFYVGEDVKDNEVKASFRDGILKLEVPKINPQEKKSKKNYIEIGD